MRLNRLEIAGFKSFADRSELAFDDGVTAIVGPNGCGKSNVVDAITWVLGEQSAKSLRGEQMEDIIFDGSDSRKPTAAAEVRLRLSGVAAQVPAQGRSRAGQPTLPTGSAGADGPIAPAAAGEVLLDDEPLIVRDVEIVAPPLSVGRERVPDRRRSLPAARHPRPADGLGPRREGVRRDRAGQDRPDPQRPADRPRS